MGGRVWKAFFWDPKSSIFHVTHARVLARNNGSAIAPFEDVMIQSGYSTLLDRGEPDVLTPERVRAEYLMCGSLVLC